MLIWYNHVGLTESLTTLNPTNLLVNWRLKKRVSEPMTDEAELLCNMLHEPATNDPTMLAVPTIVGVQDAGVNCAVGAEEGFEGLGLGEHLERVDLRDEGCVTIRSHCQKGIGRE